MNDKVLLTGISGWKGKHVAIELLNSVIKLGLV
jgi:nucleoside-diphosphate-sugar epimerase